MNFKELVRWDQPATKLLLLLVALVLQMAAFRVDAQGTTVKPANQEQRSQASGELDSVCSNEVIGSPYIPVDHWIYPAVMRLYAMGYASDVYLGLRPWTRSSVIHMLEMT